jgi:hypothetical protein
MLSFGAQRTGAVAVAETAAEAKDEAEAEAEAENEDDAARGTLAEGGVGRGVGGEASGDPIGVSSGLHDSVSYEKALTGTSGESTLRLRRRLRGGTMMRRSLRRGVLGLVGGRGLEVGVR